MPNLPYKNVAETIPFGGVTLTIPAAGSTFRALNWKPEKNTRKIRRNNGNGDQAEFMLRAEPTTQTGLTLQIADSTTVLPKLGDEFTFETLVYVVTKVGHSRPEGEMNVVDIDYESKALPAD